MTLALSNVLSFAASRVSVHLGSLKYLTVIAPECRPSKGRDANVAEETRESHTRRGESREARLESDSIPRVGRR